MPRVPSVKTFFVPFILNFFIEYIIMLTKGKNESILKRLKNLMNCQTKKNIILLIEFSLYDIINSWLKVP